MLAVPTQPPPSNSPPSWKDMKGALIASAVFHATLFAVLTLGLPFFPDKETEILPPVSVEVIDIAEIAQTNNLAPPRPTKPEPEKAEDKPEPAPAEQPEAPPQMTAEAPPNLAEPEPPKVEDLPEPEPLPAPEPLKKPQPPKKVEKKPEVTKTATPPKPKEEAKPQQQQQFASLLKNLAAKETASGTDPAPDAATRVNPDVAQLAELANRLTISEQDALRRQLAQCWVVMAGAKYAEDLAVEVRVYMNPDRTVQKVDILNQLRYNTDSHYRAAADAAYRALRNPRCSPLDLPPNKFDEWKNFVVMFDPKDML